jgi:hypothetical protein
VDCFIAVGPASFDHINLSWICTYTTYIWPFACACFSTVCDAWTTGHNDDRWPAGQYQSTSPSTYFDDPWLSTAHSLSRYVPFMFCSHYKRLIHFSASLKLDRNRKQKCCNICMLLQRYESATWVLWSDSAATVIDCFNYKIIMWILLQICEHYWAANYPYGA